MAAPPSKLATITFFFFLIITLLTMPKDVHGATAATNSFNITEILNEFPEFATFNTLLSQTNLAAEINARQTITVLVSDNAAASAITSLPSMDTRKKVLAVQVVLDYYDPVKLDSMASNTVQLTTLFQASGAATGHTGFVTFKRGGDDQMAFGSSSEPAAKYSLLVKVVACRPYNVSVMQINAPIIPPGITGAGEGDEGGGGAPVAYDPPLLAASSVSTTTMDVEEPEFSKDDDDDRVAEEPSPAAADASTPLLVGWYYILVSCTNVVVGLVIFMI